jgi:hypothetical protein
VDALKFPLILFATLLLCACPDTPTETPDAGGPALDAQAELSDAGVTADASITDGDAGGCGGSGQNCADGETCSVYGRCFSGECLVHDDCQADQRCAGGQCLARPTPEFGILFERVHDMAFANHRSRIPSGDERRSASAFGDFGFGAALFDMDGDQDLDLFIGSQGRGDSADSPSCIYRNESVPSAPHFVAEPLFCNYKSPGMSGGYGTDLEGDGYHELILTGFNSIRIQRFHPQLELIDLHALIPVDDERASCNAGAALSMDFDRDGLIDVLIGCQFDDVGEHGSNGKHLLFRQLPSGGFSFVERREVDKGEPLLLEAWGSTLGLGAAHLNDDGLLDLLVSEDEATRPQYLPPDPGGLYMSCTPLENCYFRPVRLGYEELAWGGYMGSAVLQVLPHGRMAYFSDLARNRMVAFDVDGQPDMAGQLRTNLYEGLPTFSWGVFADDLDRDGRDDLLVAQGATKSSSQREYPLHYDAALLQRSQANFTTHSEEIGLAPSTTADSRNDDYSYATRAVLRTDIDFDGHIDLINTALEGLPRMQREVPAANDLPPRCTLIPIDRYVPGFGVGHSLRSPADGLWRQWDSQGQLRSGTSPYSLSPWTSGTMRFPSGAEVDYDCQGGPGPLRVEEPEWIRFSRSFTRVIIAIGDAAPEGELQVYAEPEGALLELEAMSPADGYRRFSVAAPDGTETLMLRFDRWWVARRFRL